MFFQGTAGIDVVVRAKKEPQPDTNDKMLQSLGQHWKTIMTCLQQNIECLQIEQT